MIALRAIQIELPAYLNDVLSRLIYRHMDGLIFITD